MESWLEFILFLSLWPTHTCSFDAWAMVCVDGNQVSLCCPPQTETTLCQSLLSSLCFQAHLSFSLHPEQNEIILLIPDTQLMLLKSARPILYLPCNFCWLKWNRGADFLTHITHTNCKPKQGTKHLGSRFLVISFKRDRLLLYVSQKLWFACGKTSIFLTPAWALWSLWRDHISEFMMWKLFLSVLGIIAIPQSLIHGEHQPKGSTKTNIY